MKKAACAVLILMMIIFLVCPLPSNAGSGGHWGGHGGGHGGGYWGWWWPWAVIGGAAVAATYYAPYYYSPYYAPAPVVIQEQPQVYAQSGPSVQPSSSDRLFVYARQGQSEQLQAKDRYECHSWAVGQTRYDPTRPSGGMSQDQLYRMRADYQRAMGACLDGRGYTAK